jgi:transposase
MPVGVRKDKIRIEAERLERLYRECDGWAQRMHEKLVEEEGIQISYSTLTRRLRELGLSQEQKRRCDPVHLPQLLVKVPHVQVRILLGIKPQHLFRQF